MTVTERSTQADLPSNATSTQVSSDTALTKLEQALERRGAEIDSLQIEVARRNRPFYREPAAIIAVLALIASLVATLLSQGASTTDRHISQRSRLTAVVKDIADWQRDAVDPQTSAYTTDYGGRPLLNEASYLIDALEETRFRSTPFEKVVVAEGYINTYDPEEAARLAAKAVMQAGGRLTGRLPALRVHASSLFSTNRAEEGRLAYDQAIKAIDDGVAVISPFLTSFLYFGVHQQWFYDELRVNNCQGMRQLIEQLRLDVSKFGMAGDGGRLAQLQSMQTVVDTNCVGV